MHVCADYIWQVRANGVWLATFPDAQLPRAGAINQLSIHGTSVERALVAFPRAHYWQMANDGESCANFISPHKHEGGEAAC